MANISLAENGFYYNPLVRNVISEWQKCDWLMAFGWPLFRPRLGFPALAERRLGGFDAAWRPGLTHRAGHALSVQNLGIFLIVVLP